MNASRARFYKDVAKIAASSSQGKCREEEGGARSSGIDSLGLMVWVKDGERLCPLFSYLVPLLPRSTRVT